MKIFVIALPLVLFPTLALSQQALVEKGFAEFYLSGAGGAGKGTWLYGGEFGIGLNGEAALSVGHAGVDQENPTRHSTTVTPTLTLAFHTKNQREQSIVAFSFGVTTGKLDEQSGNKGQTLNLGLSGFVKKLLNSRVVFMPGGGITMVFPIGQQRSTGMAAGVSATAGFRFNWAPSSYGFIIPGVVIAGDVKTVTIEAGIGIKGKFKPQTRRE